MATRTPRVIPTVFATDKKTFHERYKRLLGIAPRIQIDIMDGRFVKAKSIPLSDMPDVAKRKEQFEAHLMVRHPRKCIPLLHGFDRVILHVEAHRDARDVKESILLARATRLEPMLALNPETPLERIIPFLPLVTGILVMGVHPGKEQQHITHQVYDKIAELRALDPQLHIQVDGGVTPETARHLALSGANAVNSGSYVSEGDSRRRLAELDKAMHVEGKHLARRNMPVLELQRIANELRQAVVTMLAHAQSGHTAGPLGMADIYSALFFNVLRYDPHEPENDERDRLFLSNGHICPIHYAAMAQAGFFDKDELLTFRQPGSRLQGHPHNTSLPGIENSGGPLAQGLSQAAGCALALKRDKRATRVFCIASDGEQDEGQAWEAALFAGHARLGNLTVIMDRNNIQIDGCTNRILDIEPLADKYRAFKWHVQEVDGHDIKALLKAIEKAERSERPSIIIAKTIGGKGVKAFERKPEWHGKPPSEEEAALAIKQLERQLEHLGGRR